MKNDIRNLRSLERELQRLQANKRELEAKLESNVRYYRRNFFETWLSGIICTQPGRDASTQAWGNSWVGKTVAAFFVKMRDSLAHITASEIAEAALRMFRRRAE